ncbi:MAG: SurA N-terminal domain-containing protein [Buchnera aphidicola (Meitanaphis elongallis)]
MILKKIKFIFSNIILLTFLIIIVLSLIITKMNYHSLKYKKNYVIKINEDTISLETFTRAYTAVLLQNKKSLNTSSLNTLYNRSYIKKLYKQTISNIIYETLLKQYLKKLNVFVSNTSIQNYVYNQQIFRKNNVFDIQKYYFFLNSHNINTKEYIETIKTNLAIKKFISSITNSTFILKKDSNNFIKLLSQIRVIRIAPINKKNYYSLVRVQKTNSFAMIKEITNECNNGSETLFKKMNLKFEKPQFFYKFSTNKLGQLIFSLPSLKKNNICFNIIKNNNDLFLVQFYKIMHINISKQQKKVLLSQLLKHNTKMILNSILHNLYTQANISYGKLINFKKYL